MEENELFHLVKFFDLIGAHNEQEIAMSDDVYLKLSKLINERAVESIMYDIDSSVYKNDRLSVCTCGYTIHFIKLNKQ